MNTTTQIAASLQRIFDLFVRIGYIPAESVRPGPHNDADLDVDRLRRLGMDDRAIEFIKNIPWVVGETVDLIVSSEVISWKDPFDLESSRKLCTNDGGVSFCVDRNLNGSWLSLTIPLAAKSKKRRGHLLVIDTARGTVRQWDGIDPPRLQDIPGEPAHYFFNRVHERYQHLEQIPYDATIFEPIDTAEHAPEDRAQNATHTDAYQMLKLAADESGWPSSDFPHVEFRENAAQYLGDLIRKHRIIWRAEAPSHLINPNPYLGMAAAYGEEEDNEDDDDDEEEEDDDDDDEEEEENEEQQEEEELGEGENGIHRNSESLENGVVDLNPEGESEQAGLSNGVYR
ncbi:hypothetical protein H2200_010383 [Cladophialophora chaetospira]|uniref:Uncharacterized protein n=1 Tax=Cladophialophora chaetospira TaxID=386627 RepID=A0AA38X1D6_9EURO|nr:hypothetical protein H2200_010383 [Cladophialophora chaetospira]